MQTQGKNEIEFLIDIDDTLIPWEKPNAIAFPNMSKAMAKYSGIDHDTIVKDIQHVNSLHGTIEYSALIQEMPCFKRFSEHRKDKLIDIAVNAKRSPLNKHKLPFKDITILLTAIKTNGLVMRTLSDAPAFLAHRRLANAGIIGYFDELIARESPENTVFPIRYQHKKPYVIKTTVSKNSKPHTDLPEILNLSEAEISRYRIMIGNSSRCDETLAQRFGMLFYKTNWDEGTEEERVILSHAPENILPSTEKTLSISENGPFTQRDGFQKIDVYSPLDIMYDLRERGILQTIIAPQSE